MEEQLELVFEHFKTPKELVGVVVDNLHVEVNLGRGLGVRFKAGKARGEVTARNLLGTEIWLGATNLVSQVPKHLKESAADQAKRALNRHRREHRLL